MQEANGHLSPEQARHLTQHGVNQNEDGTYSWKFDNYVRAEPPYEMTTAEIEELWRRIICPTLLVYGKESWASNPSDDGRISHFSTPGSSRSITPAIGCITTGSSRFSTSSEAFSDPTADRAPPGTGGVLAADPRRSATQEAQITRRCRRSDTIPDRPA